MSNLSQVQLGSTTYELEATNYFVKGTQTAATGTWTGALSGVAALYTGLTIAYYLPYAGSGNATLNLTLDSGATGAINCYYQGGTRLTTHYPAGSIILLTYAKAGEISVAGTATTDNRWIAGQNYVDGNTRYGDCDTAAATAAKAANFTCYELLANSYCIIRMRYANSSATAITMNINGKGAKPIYINGAASSTTNYTLPAGTYLVYYNGTNYYFRTDGKFPNESGLTKATVTAALGYTPPTTNTTYTFTNKAATLAWNTTTTIATVGNTDITVKLPANPDTNTHTVCSGTSADANALIWIDTN